MKMSNWRTRAKEKWTKNRGKNWQYNSNPIERFRYCLHEWRWCAFNDSMSWFSNTIWWVKGYLGVK